MQRLEATSFAMSRLSDRWFLAGPPPQGRRSVLRRKVIIRAKREMDDRWDYDGKLVDENMIVLRMRIRETKNSQLSHVLPLDWMEWEKKYYKCYNEQICEALGLLQSVLMNTRPSLGLGMVALIALSVPISTFVLFLHAVKLAKGFY